MRVECQWLFAVPGIEVYCLSCKRHTVSAVSTAPLKAGTEVPAAEGPELSDSLPF